MGRNYSSTAVRTTLTAGISASATTVPVASLTGYPTSYPYTIIVDADTASEEIMSVTAASGLSLTVDRGIGGTSGVTHAIGAAVQHGVYHEDFQEAADHIGATQAHGLDSDVVGLDDVQTLTGKTMSGANNTFSNIPKSAVTNLVSDLATLTTADSTESAARIAGDALKQDLDEKGTANGYAELDAGAKLPIGRVPTGTSGTTVALGDHSHDSEYWTAVRGSTLTIPGTGNNSPAVSKSWTAESGVAYKVTFTVTGVRSSGSNRVRGRIGLTNLAGLAYDGDVRIASNQNNYDSGTSIVDVFVGSGSAVTAFGMVYQDAGSDNLEIEDAYLVIERI